MSGVVTRKGASVRSSKGFGGLFKGQDLFRIFLFFLTIVTISRIHEPLGLRSLRPALVLAAGSLAYAVLRPQVVYWKGLLQYWPARVIAALAVVACLSAAFGISLGASATFMLEEYSKVLVFTALLIVAFRGASDVRLIVAAYVISAGILVYFALFVFALSATNTGMMRLDNLYTYDANDIGLVLLVAVPLALWLVGTMNGRGKGLIVVLLLGIGAAVARSGSRGTFVGALALGLSLLFFVRHLSLQRRLLIAGVISLGLLATAPSGYWEQMKTLLNPKDDYNWSSVDGRRQLALRGLGYMWDHPVFGIGLGNFPRAEGMISEKAMTHLPGTGIRWTPAHNSYVQVAAELGLTGLLLWCSLVVGGIVGMARLRRRLPRHWARGDPEQRFLYAATMYLPAAYVAFAVPAAFLSFAYRDPIYVLSALFCGVYAAVHRRLTRERAAAAMRFSAGGGPLVSQTGFSRQLARDGRFARRRLHGRPPA